MENQTFPNIVRIASAFFITACIFLVIYLGADILAPLILALLFAIMLRPVITFLMNKLKFPQIVAVAVALFLALVLVASLLFFMGLQLTHFVEDLPGIKQKLFEHYHTLQDWLSKQFGISRREQEEYYKKVDVTSFVSLSSLGSITNGVMYIVLVPIYTFLILIYRTLILNFVIKLVTPSNVMMVQEVLKNVKMVVRSYVVGLIIQVICVSALTALGYFIIGMKYYIFLGIMTGLLNLVPYIGILFSGVISGLIALTVSSDLMLIVWLLCVNVVVQFIDNNIISPKVVGSKVSINALSSMIGVIIGGAIAGIAGMFLAIPMLAILKVIFESSKDLEPYGYLIGDDIPKHFNWNKIRMIYDRKARAIEAEKEQQANTPPTDLSSDEKKQDN